MSSRNDRTFTHQLRVRYNECDTQDVVFNANYLAYVDVTFIEFVREVAGSYKEFVASGTDVVLSEVNVRYLSPAQADDVLDISVQVTKLGRSSMFARYEIARQGEVLAECDARYVFIATSGEMRSVPLSDGWRVAFERYLAPAAMGSENG